MNKLVCKVGWEVQQRGPERCIPAAAGARPEGLPPNDATVLVVLRTVFWTGTPGRVRHGQARAVMGTRTVLRFRGSRALAQDPAGRSREAPTPKQGVSPIQSTRVHEGMVAAPFFKSPRRLPHGPHDGRPSSNRRPAPSSRGRVCWSAPEDGAGTFARMAPCRRFSFERAARQVQPGMPSRAPRKEPGASACPAASLQPGTTWT